MIGAKESATAVRMCFLTVVLTLGVLSALRAGGVRVPRFVLAGLHRNLTLAGIGFLLVGQVTLDLPATM